MQLTVEGTFIHLFRKGGGVECVGQNGLALTRSSYAFRCVMSVQKCSLTGTSKEKLFLSRERLIDVVCEERNRLNRVYLDATAKVFGAGKAVAQMTSSEWREATKAAREVCKAALANLKRHRKEHGC
jgi:hypothetical protein